MSIEGIPVELNLRRENFGKEASEIDYDRIGPCPICNSRIDEFNFCACGGNLGVSYTGHIWPTFWVGLRPTIMIEVREHLERYGWRIIELESLVQRKLINSMICMKSAT